MKLLPVILIGVMLGLFVDAKVTEYRMDHPRPMTAAEKHNLDVQLCYMMKSAGEDALAEAAGDPIVPCPEFIHD